MVDIIFTRGIWLAVDLEDSIIVIASADTEAKVRQMVEDLGGIQIRDNPYRSPATDRTWVATNNRR